MNDNDVSRMILVYEIISNENFTTTEWEAGMVEGEQILTASDVCVPRGQAEGERLEGAVAVSLTPRPHRTLSDSGSSNEWDSSSKQLTLMKCFT